MTKTKPRKPHADFLLFAHANGQWAKKIRGQLYYFGRWSDPQGSLRLYLDQKDDLLAGRRPRIHRDGFTIRELCNRFLTVKRARVNEGQLSDRSFADYRSVCEWVVRHFGLHRCVEDIAADDFEEFRRAIGARRKTPSALGTVIQRVRTVFRFAFEMGFIERPIRFGPEFRVPGRTAVRLAKAQSGSRFIAAKEIRRLLANASPHMQAMILLGVNCGFGQTDIANLPSSAVDLRNSVLDFPRPKTGIARRCILWGETTTALESVLDSRPSPHLEVDSELVFLTRFGRKCVRVSSAGRPIDTICPEFTKLLKRLDLYRPKLGFYALRHTFETIGGESKDQVAVDHIMGHVDNSMAGVYRERISDERLKAVTDTVHDWLFGSEEE